jgi:hypothetical protein
MTYNGRNYTAIHVTSHVHPKAATKATKNMTTVPENKTTQNTDDAIDSTETHIAIHGHKYVQIIGK